jgi:phosphoserine phosphatase
MQAPNDPVVSPTVIYIDIDDTLIRSFGSKRIPMSEMVALVPQLRQHGATLYCWSSGGAAYARASAEELGIADCFTAFLPKPHLLVDDVTVDKWKLAELHPNECRSLTVPELLEVARARNTRAR